MKSQKARRRRPSAGRVRGRCCQRPLPSEPYMKVSPHTAQAFANAPLGTRGLPLPNGQRLAASELAETASRSAANQAFASRQATTPRVAVGEVRDFPGKRQDHAEPARAPPPTRRPLHDTRLEPAKRAVNDRTLGSRTSKPFGCQHICIAPLAGWPGSLVTEDRGEVCRLSPWGNLAGWRNPCPPDCRAAFACSPLLCPQPRQVVSRLPCPKGEATGLPRSVTATERVRLRLSAGGATAACGQTLSTRTWPRTFWSKPDPAAPKDGGHGISRTAGSLFGLSNSTAFSRHFN